MPSPDQRAALVEKLAALRDSVASEPFTEEHQKELDKLLAEHMSNLHPVTHPRSNITTVPDPHSDHIYTTMLYYTYP